ncbi:MAG: AraC family transcriptional regulator [Acutalibacteraceae bacterium]|nr:AraC family transcriptional regulator [Acutalibacteraceae bacterium]
MGERIYRYLLKANAKEGSNIIVSERFVKESSALHWHNFIELELVTGGSGYHILNGQRFELSRGSLYLLRLVDFHEVKPVPSLNLINMAIDDSLLSEELLAQLTAGKPLIYSLDEKETCVMEQLLRLCMEENDEKKPHQRYLKHLLICILLRILKLVPDNGDYVPLKDKPIQAAILYLHLHFRENPKLSDLAKISHYNTSHFSTTFHKELGMTYSQYLNMLKINYAKELLLSTPLKITEVCYECGFASQSNFLRLFKEYTGFSPLEFRKKDSEKNKSKTDI